MSEGHPKVDAIMVGLRHHIKGNPETQDFITNYNAIYKVIEELVRKIELQNDIIE